MLFADPLAPAVIDFAPYWRPAGSAAAVVVADAIAWHQASLDLTGILASDEDPRSMPARAAIFRLVTSDRAAATRAGDRSAHLQDNLAALSRVLVALQRI